MSYGINAPFGLQPVFSVNGGAWTEKSTEYRLSTTANGVTTYNTNIFTGDPVVFNAVAANNGAGTIARYPFNDQGSAAGANAVPVLGVFVGCEYFLPTGRLVKSPYWAAGTQVLANSVIKAYVLDDPSMEFNMQVSTWTNIPNDARFTLDKVGQNFGFGLGGGGNALIPNNPADGNTRTGQSAVYLATTFNNNDIVHTTATLPLKAIGYDLNPNNLNQPISYTADATTATFLNVRVLINNHVFKVGTLGTVAA